MHQLFVKFRLLQSSNLKLKNRCVYIERDKAWMSSGEIILIMLQWTENKGGMSDTLVNILKSLPRE